MDYIFLVGYEKCGKFDKIEFIDPTMGTFSRIGMDLQQHYIFILKYLQNHFDAGL